MVYLELDPRQSWFTNHSELRSDLIAENPDKGLNGWIMKGKRRRGDNQLRRDIYLADDSDNGSLEGRDKENSSGGGL